MKIRYLLLLIGAFFFVPMCYDLFKGTDALKAVLKDDIKKYELLAVCLIVLAVVWCVVTPYAYT